MVNREYYENVHGVKWELLEDIVAELIGFDQASHRTDTNCLEHHLEELVNETTEQRYRLQRQIQGFADDGDTPVVSELRSMLEVTDARLRQYESQLEQARELIETVEIAILNEQGGNLQAEFDENIGKMLISRANFFRWIEKRDEEKAKLISEAKLVPQTFQLNRTPEKPWMVHDPDDPEPEQPWYTPARYFAREFFKKAPVGRRKKASIANEVSSMMHTAGIKGRGGKSPLDPGTILKALSNVNLS